MNTIQFNLKATRSKNGALSLDTMDTEHNPAYGVRLQRTGNPLQTPGPYEDMDITDTGNNSTYTSLKVLPAANEINYQTLTQSTTASSNKPRKKKTDSRVALILIALTSAVAILLVLMLGAIVGLLHSTSRTDMEIQLETLQLEVNNLRELLNVTLVLPSNTSMDGSHLQLQINELYKANQSVAQFTTNISEHVNSLFAAMTSLNMDTQNNITQLAIQVATDQDTTTSQLSSLQSSVNNLDTRISSPINIYENCTEESTNCTADTFPHDRLYRTGCDTLGIPLNRKGYFTIDMRCEYNSELGYLEATRLRRINGHAQCRCSVTDPDLFDRSPNPLQMGFSFTCTLVVLRCPLSLLHTD